MLGAGFPMNPLPVQPVKLHCPPPRSDTLSRERLNGWLDRAAAGRVALIVADAGYGKTTLLADWSMHTSRLTTWYRLEPADRDWLTFIRHLVGGGREIEPDFAPETFRLLHAIGPGGPTPVDLAATLAREMAEFGVATGRGLTLLLDDYHEVDGFHETDPLVRALVERTGPGFSIVFSGRTTPKIGLGRLRARGGVQAIDGADLRFDLDETRRLFRDAYRLPLEDDVAADLHERTEGWAALLTLVRTGLEEHEDARALVAHLAASHGDMYEFLAEEVLAALSPELAFVLERAALLMAVDPFTTTLVTELPEASVLAHVDEAERLGLLTRPDRESAHRFHPLVREFLVARLTSNVGPECVRDLHRHVARNVAGRDWHAGAWHYLQAGDASDCERTVDAAVETILAAGSFEVVKPFLDPEAGDPQRTTALILRSKIEFGRGHFARSVDLARASVAAAGTGEYAGLSRLVLASILGVAGFGDDALAVARDALNWELSATQRNVADASLELWKASEDGNLHAIEEWLAELARRQELAGQRRYAGITRLNRACILMWTGETEDAALEGGRAEVLLGGRSNKSVERASATAIRASAMAQLGQLAEADKVLRDALLSAPPLAIDELAYEGARYALDFGSVEGAEWALNQQDPSRMSPGHLSARALQLGQLALRRGNLAAAAESADSLTRTRFADAAGRFRTRLLVARLAMASGSPTAAVEISALEQVAAAQTARPGIYVARLLRAINNAEDLSPLFLQAEESIVFVWSLIAEEIARSLADVSTSAMARLAREASLRPERWRSALRLAVDRSAGATAAAALLADIGDREDAAFLRTLASIKKVMRPPALKITKRLAVPLIVGDLGAVDVRIGETVLPRGLRRKVLGLLCFLSSRPGMAASRDEALEALWGDLSLEAGGNSLHQAIYFLRRIIEPDFRDSISAGYILVDGDVVSLNRDLVDSASRQCWTALRQHANGDRAAIDRILALYRGRYALDFAYDEWALGYRETLHAAVLSAGEAAQADARAAGDFERSIQIGQGVLAIDPQADAIELELLRAYKASGRHAAAAEQYTHYSSFIRNELAADPPPFGEI